jgi:lactate racemase
MKIDVPFKDKVESIDLDSRNVEQVLVPNAVRSGNEMQILRSAISEPLDSPPLEKFLDGCSNILLLANDATRPTPTSRILEIIHPVLTGRNFKILIATGSHRPPTEDEYDYIFGRFHTVVKPFVRVHDAKSSECFVLGKTRNGNQIKLNTMVAEADAIIPIGSIEPHYFAGYTGGRKSFMPGAASLDCITANHRLAMSVGAQAMAVRGNPVAEELDDAEEMLRDYKIFAIMTVLDGSHKTYAAAAGGLGSSFRALIPKADEIFVVPIRRKSEIVVTVAAQPNDIDLYQSQKALDNGRHALLDGGIIILVSACRQGIGPRAFLDLLGSESTCKGVLEKLEREYKLGYHKAGKIAEIGLRSEMWAVTPLDRDLVARAHMRPFGSVGEALREALLKKGPDARVTFILDGGLTIPRLV